MKKIVVFTGNLSFSVRKGIVEIIDHYPDTQLLIAHQAPKKKIKQLAKNQWRNVKKNGWRWIPYQSLEIGRESTA